MEPFRGGVWPQHLEEIERALDEVERARRGVLLLYRGDPELSRTRLLADALVRLARRSPRPGLMAGGFDVAGSRGDYTARPLPLTGLRAETVLRALGVAGAAVAVPDPAGALRLAGALASLLGEAGPAAESAEPPQRFQDPYELLDTLEGRLREERRLVLCLADVDRAAPPLDWWDFFLLRLLPPLLHKHALLVLATATSTGALAGGDQLAELGDAGLARAVELHPYTAREIAAELGDAALAEDVAGLTGGDPERVAAQFAGWRRDGLVEQRDGAWHYTAGREAALDGAGRQAQRLLILTLGSPDPAPYDRAVRVLRTAALEGMTFTVQPLARVLEEDPDELSDFLDDHLVRDDAHRYAPLEAEGFVEGTSLYRYRFRSRLLWTVFHPVHGRGEWHETMGHRRLAARYADALAEAYGASSQEAVFRVWDLRRQAGDADPGHYAAMANALASVPAIVRLLDADLELDDATLSPAALTAAVRRFVANGPQIMRAVASDRFLLYAQRAQARLPGLTGPDAVTLTREALMLLSAAAKLMGWHGDAARAAARVLDDLAEHEVTGQARILTSLTDVLLGLVRTADTERDWSEAAQERLGVPVPWLDAVLLAPGDLADRSTRVLAFVGELIARGRRLLPALPPNTRPHREAHILHATGLVLALQGDYADARDTLRGALGLLEGQWWGCAVDAFARADLAACLDALADRDAAAAEWRRATVLALAHGHLVSVAPGLAGLARAELERERSEEAARFAGHAVVVAARLDPVDARPAWESLGDALGDERCREIAASDDPAGEAALGYLKRLTGIGEAETDAFLATFR